MKPPPQPSDAVFTEITPYQVLMECIIRYEGDKRSWSRDGAFQIPKPGFERAIKDTDKKIEILQGFLREARYGTTKEG